MSVPRISAALLGVVGCSTTAPAVESPTPESPSTSIPQAKAAADHASSSHADGDSDWTSDAIYDLARVRAGTVQDVPHCKEGMPSFAAKWRAIDAWGEPVGEVEGSFDGGHYYALVSGNRGVGVYVRTMAWSVESARWDASATERAAHEMWLRSLDPAVEDAEIQFFQTRAPAEPSKLALVVSRSVLLVSRRTAAGEWQVAYVDRASEAEWPLFEHRAIVDMNGDGVPEVIAHFNEQSDGHGHEMVLASSDGGRSFEHIADNHDDCP